ncbi:FAD-dependent monooxygenase [Leucobacter sp. CSA1]|uniref:FAD-dependent monooxygenase n=1 Tax=Leucobacter chromiisoli TaxID=2796471 RepID=A0A934Q9C8_9MICO|nr:FAD-dependent monooxygenase [Leucobacter chromiisoli]MBK0420296.1 FAD-dependent monooxygenase [Leucobacter chromiisoli]
MNTIPAVETEVLIVGAGPAGAAAGALLATYGIDAMMINKYNSVANTPRAHITNQRAMEVLRDLGLERQAKAASTPQNLMGDHVYATSLAGQELGRIRTWYTHPSFKAEHDLASPTAVCDIPQDKMEPILVGAASYRGTTVRSGTELLGFEQDDDGVTSTLRDRVTGEQYTVRSRYLIGADGGRSLVAEQLGLRFEGEMVASASMNVVFRADLSHLVEHRPSDMYWFLQQGVGHGGVGVGVLRVVDTWDRWVGVWGFDASQGTPELTDELGTSIAHKLIGDDTVPVEIESLSTWGVNRKYAVENTRGRAFIVGDAAHRHSPMNGLGSNTSIQDSYNLAWKLALVLRGLAGPGLLESYAEERLPIAKHLVDRTVRSEGLMPGMFKALRLPPGFEESVLAQVLENLEAPTEEGAERRAEFRAAMDATLACFNTHGMELNQFYSSRAVVTDGAEAPVPERDVELHYFPSSFPGHHLPHAWVVKDQRRTPIFDLCGKGGFTILAGDRGAAWRDAAAVVSEELGLPLDVVVIGRGGDYEDAYGDFAAVAQIGELGALLVRPDHMIGWRTTETADADELLRVLRSILDR